MRPRKHLSHAADGLLVATSTAVHNTPLLVGHAYMAHVQRCPRDAAGRACLSGVADMLMCELQLPTR